MANTGAEVLLVISNAAFIIPSIKAATLHRWTRAILYFLMIFASSFYHSCKSAPSTCVFPAPIARKMDFFFAQTLIIVTALYLIYFPARYAFIERWAILLGMFALFVTEVFLNEPFSVQIIVAAISLAVVIIYWCFYARFEYLVTGHAKIPPYDWDPLVMGIALTALACTLFATQAGWSDGYPWVHSIWHVSAALGQFFVLASRDAGDRMASLDKRVEKRYAVFEAMISG